MNDKMSRYNKQMGARKFLYENLQLGVANLVVSLREPMGFLTRNWWFPYEKPEASNWEKSFSQLGTYFLRTYVHGLTNLCSWVREPMFIGLRTYVLRNVLLVVMMVLGVNSAWSQTAYSGVYYIKNNNNNTFYLCTSTVFYDGNHYANSGDMPYLTTAKTTTIDSWEDEAVWRIIKAESDDYYYVVHAVDGKYLTLNNDPSTYCDKNGHRLSLHLQYLKDEDK